MPHPLAIINKANWNYFLTFFRETIVLLADEDGLPISEVNQLTRKYVEAVNDRMEEVFTATSQRIQEYLNFYNVNPTHGVHDEFKGIYFSGMAVSCYLDHLGLAELNKLHLRAVLRLLDFRLHIPHDARREHLTKRINAVINYNAVDAHLGKYGWYLTYKCLYNAAHDRANSTL